MRILIIQLRRLGDVLLTTPLLRAIRQGHPESEIHYCVDAACLAAVRDNPNLDRLVVTGTRSTLRLAHTLRQTGYDVALDCRGTPASARLTYLSGARVRVGFSRPWRRLFYTHAMPLPVTPVYSALEKLSLLEPLGIRCTDCRLELYPTRDDRAQAERFWTRLAIRPDQTVVAFSPVSRRADKVWPPERFAEVCDEVFDQTGLRFLPLFGPDEEAQVDRIVTRARHRAAFIYPCPTVSFVALYPVMERCAFYFGHDNGIRHVAIAAGLPTAAIFGPPDPRAWTPPGSPHHRYVGGGCDIGSITVGETAVMLERTIATCRARGRCR